MAGDVFNRVAQNGEELLFISRFRLRNAWHAFWHRYAIKNRSYLIITNRGPTPSREVPIEKISDIQINRKWYSFGWVFNYGTLTVRYSGMEANVPFEWRHVWQPDEVRSLIWAVKQGDYRLIDGKSTAIPDSVKLGTKIALIPRLPWEVNTPLWAMEADTVLAGQWVNQGDPLWTFNLPTSWFEGFTGVRRRNMDILSPVSGLVIAAAGDIYTKPGLGDSAIAILMPEHDTRSLGTEFAFGSYGRVCKERYEFLFNRSSGGEGPKYTYEEVRNKIARLLGKEISVVDIVKHPYEPVSRIWNDNVHIGELLPDLRKRSPEVSAALQHLEQIEIDDSEERMPQDKAAVRDSLVSVQEADWLQNAPKDQIVQELKHALDFMHLEAVPGTLAELRTHYLKMRKTYPEDMWDELNQCYDMLKQQFA